MKPILTVTALPLAGALVYGFTHPKVVRAYVVPWSCMQQVKPGLYLDPQMNATARTALLGDLAAARERVAGLFGPQLKASPVLIVSDSEQVINQYGTAFGATYYTPIGDYVVIGPKGMNVDVLAHELAHTELRARIRSKVPMWFDEGLAATLDRRLDKSETEWAALTGGGKTAPALSELVTPAQFQAVSRQSNALAYISARREVTRWQRIVGQEGFAELVQALAEGKDFAESYAAIERAHTR